MLSVGRNNGLKSSNKKWEALAPLYFLGRFLKHKGSCSVQIDNNPFFFSFIPSMFNRTHNFTSSTTWITEPKTAAFFCSCVSGIETNPEQGESCWIGLVLLEVLIIPPAGIWKQEKELGWQRGPRRPRNPIWNSGKTWELEKEKIRRSIAGNNKCWGVWCSSVAKFVRLKKIIEVREMSGD